MRVLPAFSATLPSPGAVASRPCADLSGWECLTRAACRAQADQRLEQALAGHVRALWAVEALLDGPVLRSHPDDCLAAWVVSHHSLSDLYRCRGQLNPAVEHLCAPHHLLLRLAADAPSPVQDAAWRHLRETRSALLQWQRQHGAPPRIDDCARLWPPSSTTHDSGYRH
ncbi:MAG: hypothetical protein EOO29_03675 [Comamonadaceae bacterium]|nr:MAG: hypothetical protein EOO29_03675 [Comamonadaceae bacterium]